MICKRNFNSIPSSMCFSLWNWCSALVSWEAGFLETSDKGFVCISRHSDIGLTLLYRPSILNHPP